MSEPALHPARNPDGNGLELSLKMLGVVTRVEFCQSLRNRNILSMSAMMFARTRLSGRALNWKFENGTPRFPARRSRPSFHEHNNRSPDIFGCVQKLLIYPQLATAVADYNGAIAREANCIRITEPEPLERRPQLLRIFGACILNQVKRELIFVARKYSRESF